MYIHPPLQAQCSKKLFLNRQRAGLKGFVDLPGEYLELTGQYGEMTKYPLKAEIEKRFDLTDVNIWGDDTIPHFLRVDSGNTGTLGLQPKPCFCF
jgi:hypothetical protein